MRRLCFGFVFHNKDRLDFKPSLFFLTNQLSICTISGMETREDLIKATIRGLLRIAKMYSRIEALPIPVDENLEVTTREAHTIEAVGEHEQISVTQVASHLGITKSTASQMVPKLNKKRNFPGPIVNNLNHIDF